MRRITIGTLAIALCVACVAPSAWTSDQADTGTTAPVITMQDAINTALSNNKSIAIARDQYMRSRAVVRETAANGLPHVNAQAQHSWMGPMSTVTFAIPGGPSQTLTIGSATSTTAAVALSQVLDLNRRVSLATGISELGSHIQNLSLARTEQQIILDVQNAYYNVLRTEGQRDVAQAAVTTAQERLRIAKAQFDAGTLPKFDVTRADVEVANLQQTLITAASAVDVQKSALRNVMGTDPTLPIEVHPVDVPSQPLAVTVEQSVKQALAGRPEVAAAQAGLLLSKKSVTFAQRERLPMVAASATYSWNGVTTTFQPNSTSWIVGLNASLPIFEGGAIKARINEAQSDAAAAQASLDQAKLNVGQDVKTATLNLENAYTRIQTAGKNVTEAEEALRLAQVRYQAGISLQVEVIDAESALTQAKTNQVNATYDYATALAGYQRATATQPQFQTAVVAPARPAQPAMENKK